MGYHRDTFYEIRRAFQTGGVGALVEQKRGPRSLHPNRVSTEVEQKILDYCLERPTQGAARVANELQLQRITVSAGGVRGVWLRHDLETRTKRLLRLKAAARENTIVLSEGLCSDRIRAGGANRGRDVELIAWKTWMSEKNSSSTAITYSAGRLP